MKKKFGLYFAALLFCLSISCISVFAASHDGQTSVGVGFVDSTSTSSSSSSTSSTSPIPTPTTVSSSQISDSGSTVESSRQEQVLPLTNDRGGSSGSGYWKAMSNYVGKALPRTGEFIRNNLALIGMVILSLVFFYLNKNRRKNV